jgi:arabinofuranosyltransferase
MAARLFQRTTAVVGSLLAFIVASWPIPWAHWMLTKDLNDRATTHEMAVPVAPYIAPPFQSLVAVWDDLQQWLISHYVCVRHQEHKVFERWHSETAPSRRVGENISWQDRPVMVANSVGVFAWRLPNVAVIDSFGLNDRVIAHNPVDPGAKRWMAHDRKAPAGYRECFRPNIWFTGDAIQMAQRSKPLTDAEIIACESRFAAVVGLKSGSQ